MTATVRVRIEGKVQGVWYRSWTIEQATRRGLKGWVRNRVDGSVEALFHGSLDEVRAMVEACRQGPAAARVDHIAEHPDDPPSQGGFHQLPTE